MIAIMGKTKKADLTPLGLEIERYMRDRKWTLRELASQAKSTPATISRIMRGQSKPTPETINGVAQAFGVDATRLMRLAGIPIPAPARERDATAEYISQRLDSMPDWIKEEAIQGTAKLVDAYWSIANNGDSSPFANKPGVEQAGTWVSNEHLQYMKELQEITESLRLAYMERLRQLGQMETEVGTKLGSDETKSLNQRYDELVAKLPPPLRQLWEAQGRGEKLGVSEEAS
jgi:transcriptional regulator with XRE-family HTH domain